MIVTEQLVEGLGGLDNIVDVEPCSLRIRVKVANPLHVDDAALRQPGILAVVRSGDVVQIVAGPQSDSLSETITELREQQS